MEEVSKEKSAVRLASLRKCAAARTESMKQAQVAPAVAKPVAPAVAKPVAPAATNATPSVGTQLLQDAMKNPLKGVPMPGALQQLRQKRKAQAAMRAKMAETRSGKRLVALKKCAAADRSAARLDALRKCAASPFDGAYVGGTVGGAMGAGVGALAGAGALLASKERRKRWVSTLLGSTGLGAAAGAVGGGALGHMTLQPLLTLSDTLDALRKRAAEAPAATFGEAAKRIGAQHVQNLAGAESAVAKQTAGLKDTPGFSLQNFMNVLKARKAETVEGAKALKQTAQYAGQQLKGTAATKYPRAYAYVKGFLGKVKPQAAAPAAK